MDYRHEQEKASKTTLAPLVHEDISRALQQYREALVAALQPLQQQVQAFHLDLEPCISFLSFLQWVLRGEPAEDN